MSVKAIIKVPFIGDSAVGKTSLIKTFLGERATYSTTTVGIDIYPLKKNNVEFVFWDFGGQIWFRKVIPELMQNASIIVAVFDLSRINTLMSIPEFWSKKILEICGKKTPVILVGNKLDIKNISDEIINDVVQRLKKEINLIDYVQTTIKDCNTVINLFNMIFAIILSDRGC